MQVSDFPAILKADFGLFRPFSGLYRQYRPPADMADTARFWPNQPDSARIEADSAQIEPHRRESEKKKPRRSPTRGQPRRTPRPASCRVGRGCGTSGAASVHSSTWLNS